MKPDITHILALEAKEARIKELEAVAQAAALCCPDLDANLASAHEEYMAGDIARGAYEFALSRHGAIYAALHSAGFTEKHVVYGYPVKPEPIGVLKP